MEDRVIAEHLTARLTPAIKSEIVKRQRKPKQILIIAPFLDKQRSDEQFFLQSPPKLSFKARLQA